MEICKQQIEIVVRHPPAISIDEFKRYGRLPALEWVWQTFVGSIDM